MADGSDPGKADKLRFKRAQAWKKFSRYLVLYCLSVTFCLAVLWICLNLEATVPLLRALWQVKITKVWHFCSSRSFLFLLINVIVASLLVMSGSRSEDLYDEFMRRNETARKYSVSHSLPVLAEKDDKNPANSKAIVSVTSGRTNSEIAPATPTSLGGTSPRSASLEMMQRRQTSEEATNSLSLIEAPSNEEEAANSLSLIEAPSNEEKATNSLSLLEAPSNEEEATNSVSLTEAPSNEEEATSSLSLIEAPSNEEAMPAEELRRRFDEFIANVNRQIRQEIMEQSG